MCLQYIILAFLFLCSQECSSEAPEEYSSLEMGRENDHVGHQKHRQTTLARRRNFHPYKYPPPTRPPISGPSSGPQSDTDPDSDDSYDYPTDTTATVCKDCLTTPYVDPPTDHSDVPDTLSFDDWATFYDSSKMAEYKQQQAEAAKWHESMKTRITSVEPYYYIAHLYNSSMIIQVCYYISTTYLNAIEDLRNYYKIRYLYRDTLEYEVGYVVHEIVHKYTMLVEFYHQMNYMYVNRNKFLSLVTPTSMLYTYSNMVHQSHQIIHLCNALQEIEAKYEVNPDDSVSEEQYFDANGEPEGGAKGKGKGKTGELKSIMYESMDAMIKHQLLLEQRKIELEKKRQRKLAREERKKMRLNAEQGRFSTTTRTKRPRSYPYFAHHYGWSIEEW